MSDKNATTTAEIPDLVSEAMGEPEGGEPTPADVLRRQAEILADMTGGQIRPRVEHAASNPNRVAFWFTLVVPALDEYKYRLFRVEHGLSPYPLELAQDTGVPLTTTVTSQDEYYEELRNIFSSTETRGILRTLVDMSREEHKARRVQKVRPPTAAPRRRAAR
jgi:hypothetical protein